MKIGIGRVMDLDGSVQIKKVSWVLDVGWIVGKENTVFITQLLNVKKANGW